MHSIRSLFVFLSNANILYSRKYEEWDMINVEDEDIFLPINSLSGRTMGLFKVQTL